MDELQKDDVVSDVCRVCGKLVERPKYLHRHVFMYVICADCMIPKPETEDADFEVLPPKQLTNK